MVTALLVIILAVMFGYWLYQHWGASDQTIKDPMCNLTRPDPNFDEHLRILTQETSPDIRPKTTGIPTKTVTYDGFYDFASGKTYASYGNLCLTCRPYGNVSDTYHWMKYEPYYWQRKYQHCDKYGCGGSHDPSLCPIETAPTFKGCNGHPELAKYEPTSDSPALLYDNRSEFCNRTPQDPRCPLTPTGHGVCTSCAMTEPGGPLNNVGSTVRVEDQP
jgi:hypothetical protein